MDCLCGQKMKLVVEGETIVGNYKEKLNVWACHPMGCGRVYLEGSGSEIHGTWYLPEQNERERGF